MSESTRQLAQQFLDVAPPALRWLRGGGHGVEAGAHPATLGQLRCLNMLAQQPQALHELAARCGVAAPTMSRMISGLVERGWVSRAEAPRDRRRIVLRLLPPGEQALSDLHVAALDRLTDLLDELTPAEREALAAGLAGLARALQHASPSTSGKEYSA